MNILTRLRRATERFLRNDRGAVPIEGVLASTFLIWWYIASFQFFDAFRQKNIDQKGAYTVADLISRETDAIDAGYVEGLNTLYDFLTTSRLPTTIRVTSVFWDNDNNRNAVAWSYGTGSTPGLTTAQLQTVANRIPTMAIGDYTILVETFTAYEPMFNIGLDAHWFNNFITTRPRFTTCTTWDKKDGSVPACIYTTDIDPGSNNGDDSTTDTTVVPDGST